MEYLSKHSPETLKELGKINHQKYIDGKPFAHIGFDDFFDSEIIDQILLEFPELDNNDVNFKNTNEDKFASKSEERFGPKTKQFLRFMNSQPMLDFLSELTGIENLIPDPYYLGGGLHQIKRGGFLKIHSDFNIHPTTKLDRRLNVLVYLNKDWEENYGGHFELWNREMTQCEAKYLPIFNRMVLFSTTDFSYHGHPNPLTCPEGRSRKSLALYYYTNGRPLSEINAGFENHSTIFKARVKDSIDKEMDVSYAKILENRGKIQSRNQLLRKFIPEIVIDLKNYILKKK